MAEVCSMCCNSGWVIEVKRQDGTPTTGELIPCYHPECPVTVPLVLLSVDLAGFTIVAQRRDGLIMSIGRSC